MRGETLNGLAINEAIRSATDIPSVTEYVSVMERPGSKVSLSWGGHFEVVFMLRFFPGMTWTALFRESGNGQVAQLVDVVGSPGSTPPVCLLWRGTHYDLLVAQGLASEHIQKMCMKKCAKPALGTAAGPDT